VTRSLRALELPAPWPTYTHETSSTYSVSVNVGSGTNDVLRSPSVSANRSTASHDIAGIERCDVGRRSEALAEHIARTDRARVQETKAVARSHADLVAN